MYWVKEIVYFFWVDEGGSYWEGRILRGKESGGGDGGLG